jgi:hypothetical protein
MRNAHAAIAETGIARSGYMQAPDKKSRTRRGLVLGTLIALLAIGPIAAPSFAADDGTADEPAFAQEANAAAPQTEATPQEAEPFLYEIEATEPPLAALPSLKTWALANFLIVLICILLSVVTLASLLATARRRARDAAPDEYDDYRDCIATDPPVFKWLGAGVGAASAVLFLLTENLRGTMQTANGYTWLMALILLAQIGILLVAFRGGARLYGFDASAGFRP